MKKYLFHKVINYLGIDEYENWRRDGSKSFLIETKHNHIRNALQYFMKFLKLNP